MIQQQCLNISRHLTLMHFSPMQRWNLCEIIFTLSKISCCDHIYMTIFIFEHHLSPDPLSPAWCTLHLFRHGICEIISSPGKISSCKHIFSQNYLNSTYHLAIIFLLYQSCFSLSTILMSQFCCLFEGTPVTCCSHTAHSWLHLLFNLVMIDWLIDWHAKYLIDWHAKYLISWIQLLESPIPAPPAPAPPAAAPPSQKRQVTISREPSVVP